MGRDFEALAQEAASAMPTNGASSKEEDADDDTCSYHSQVGEWYLDRDGKWQLRTGWYERTERPTYYKTPPEEALATPAYALNRSRYQFSKDRLNRGLVEAVLLRKNALNEMATFPIGSTYKKRGGYLVLGRRWRDELERDLKGDRGDSTGNHYVATYVYGHMRCVGDTEVVHEFYSESRYDDGERDRPTTVLSKTANEEELIYFIDCEGCVCAYAEVAWFYPDFLRLSRAERTNGVRRPEKVEDILEAGYSSYLKAREFLRNGKFNYNDFEPAAADQRRTDLEAAAFYVRLVMDITNFWNGELTFGRESTLDLSHGRTYWTIQEVAERGKLPDVEQFFVRAESRSALVNTLDAGSRVLLWALESALIDLLPEPKNRHRKGVPNSFWQQLVERLSEVGFPITGHMPEAKSKRRKDIYDGIEMACGLAFELRDIGAVRGFLSVILDADGQWFKEYEKKGKRIEMRWAQFNLRWANMAPGLARNAVHWQNVYASHLYMSTRSGWELRHIIQQIDALIEIHRASSAQTFCMECAAEVRPTLAAEPATDGSRVLLWPQFCAHCGARFPRSWFGERVLQIEEQEQKRREANDPGRELWGARRMIRFGFSGLVRSLLAVLKLTCTGDSVWGDKPRDRDQHPAKWLHVGKLLQSGCTSEAGETLDWFHSPCGLSLDSNVWIRYDLWRYGVLALEERAGSVDRS